VVKDGTHEVKVAMEASGAGAQVVAEWAMVVGGRWVLPTFRQQKKPPRHKWVWLDRFRSEHNLA
jgi:hypothetical protein